MVSDGDSGNVSWDEGIRQLPAPKAGRTGPTISRRTRPFVQSRRCLMVKRNRLGSTGKRKPSGLGWHHLEDNSWEK